MEIGILDFIHSSLSNPVLDAVFVFFTTIVEHGELWRRYADNEKIPQGRRLRAYSRCHDVCKQRAFAEKHRLPSKTVFGKSEYKSDNKPTKRLFISVEPQRGIICGSDGYFLF